MLGVNALEYFLEVPGRTWEQFLEYFDRLCERQGTDLWARAATDPALLASVDELTAEQVDEILARSAEEPHRGYTVLVRELRNVCDQIRSLQATMARTTDVTYMPRPQMVGDLIKDRGTDLARADLDDLLLSSHQNFNHQWEVNHADL